MFGGDSAQPAPVNSSISTDTIEQMINSIETAIKDGYRWHSAKIGGRHAELDHNCIEALNEALPVGYNLTFGVNRSWTPATAIYVLNSAMAQNKFEQPCETLNQCAQVASRVSQPIDLEKCLHTFQDYLDTWKLEACEAVKIKPNRVGGLAKARQIRDFGVSGW